MTDKNKYELEKWYESLEKEQNYVNEIKRMHSKMLANDKYLETETKHD